MDQIVLTLTGLAIVFHMFRVNLKTARRVLRPMREDERMDADGRIADRTLFYRTIAHALDWAVGVKRWMDGIGKAFCLVIGFEIFSFPFLWETYLLLIPAGGYAFLSWVARNHIAIVYRRISRLSKADQQAMRGFMVKKL